jgi:site-specific recombinase
MGFKKLLDNLKIYLEKGGRKKHANCERIDYILEKLKEKEKKLQKRLAKEKSTSKRRQMNTELKIISVQRRKGLARRNELGKKCK